MRRAYGSHEAVVVPTLTPVPSVARAPQPALPAAAPGRLRWTSVLVPVVVGLALGPVDLLLQHVLPYPFANLADSSAVWALVAFGVGWAVRGRGWPPVAGTLCLLLAVEGYYLTAVLTLGDDPSTLTDPAAQAWLALAVGAGVVFGTAGAWARSAHPWCGPLGTAAAVAVLLAEAWLDLTRLSDAGDDLAHRQDLAQTAVLLTFMATSHQALAAVVTLFMFGFVSFLATTPVQNRVVEAAGGDGSLVSATNQGAFNLANALGAWIGGVVISAGLGYTAPMWAGACLAVAGLVLTVVATRLQKAEHRRAADVPAVGKAPVSAAR